jgi:hypothetical protein
MIQFRWLALALIGASMLYFMVLTRRSAVKRLFLAVFFGTGAVFVLWPNLTSRMASLLGIGRGADLVFYLSILFLFFVSFSTHLHYGRLEARQSQLVREMALRHPVQVPSGRASDELSERVPGA